VRAVVLVVLLALPRLVAAQPAPAVVPVIGFGLGVTQLPEPLVETCGGNTRTLATVEVLAGVARGAWRAEVRGAAFSAYTINDCLTIPFSHESGIHTDRVYPFDREHGDLSMTAHVQYGPARGFWRLGLGAGRILGAEVPFLLGSASLRTRGRVAAVAEAQARWSRLRYDLVTAEWAQSERIGEIAREQDHEWHRSFALRFGAELRLR
jgi:hypothetical protein